MTCGPWEPVTTNYGFCFRLRVFRTGLPSAHIRPSALHASLRPTWNAKAEQLPPLNHLRLQVQPGMYLFIERATARYIPVGKSACLENPISLLGPVCGSSHTCSLEMLHDDRHNSPQTLYCHGRLNSISPHVAWRLPRSAITIIAVINSIYSTYYQLLPIATTIVLTYCDND